MLDLLRTLVRDNPVRVRAAGGALLVLLAQYVPAVADLAVNDTIVDGLTLVVLLVLGESASRKVAAKYNPAEIPPESAGDGNGR
ncbi:hypothetical protein [Streptomyces sp. NPDC056524]|uniref:hypothetical protein n=1 Tax=Streptomyces sp. NPDC056524 TaxID=3345851 RepID=UPI0036850ACA